MSKKCIQCNHELPDDAAFCTFCGEKQPTQSAQQTNAMPEPGASSAGIPAGSTAITSNRNKSGRLAGIGIVMVALIALIAGAVVFFQSSGSASENAMIWVEDGSYMYSWDITSGDDPIEITSFRTEDENASGYAVFTEDGEYAYLLNRYTSSDVGTLYRVELGKLSAKGDKNENYIEKIDADVREDTVYLLDDGTFLYMCGEDGRSAELRYYDGNSSRTMKDNVVGYQARGTNADILNYGFCVTDDQKVAVYTEEAEDYSYTIYCQNIGAIGGYDFLIDDGAGGYALYDANHILYEKYDFTDDNDVVELYVGGMDVESVNLADDAEGSCGFDVFAETGIFYYTLAGETSKVTLADYVTNPHAEEDAALETPVVSDYIETVTKTDSWTGETYTTTETDWDAYYEAYVAWCCAGVREECLDVLEERESAVTAYELYCYSAISGEAVLITSECGDSSPNVSAMSGDAVAVYKKSMLPDEKLSIDDIVSFLLDYVEFFYEEYEEECEYTDYNSDYDMFGLDFDSFYGDEEPEEVIVAYVNAYLTSAAGNDGYYYTISGEEEKKLDTSGLDVADCQLTDVQLFDSGNQIAVSFDGDIYVASVSKGSIKSLEDANAYEADGLLCYDGEELYYVMNGFIYDYDTTLYWYRDDAADTLILEEIESGMLYEDGTMVFLTDYLYPYGYTLTVVDISGNIETVADLDNSKETFEDIDNYKVLTNGNIVMKSSDNVLKVYDGKEVTIIAHDVESSAYYVIKEKKGTSLVISYY